MKTTKENVVQILRNFADYLESLDIEERAPYASDIEDMLEEIACNDGFGTEGQCDPRGDQRR
jgi:hypothetical protein